MTTPAAGKPADTNEQVRRRREKLEAWQARGVNPFGSRFPVTHWAGTLQARFKDSAEAELQSAGAVSVAGRIMALRHHGKSCFAVLRDQSGQIQLYARADVLGELYTAFVDLDVGDFIGRDVVMADSHHHVDVGNRLAPRPHEGAAGALDPRGGRV